MNTDVIIIGAGPVGIFTAFQAGMLGMRVHVVDSLPSIGGQCTALYPEKFIYDIPGYKQITAAALISNLADQAERFNPTYHTGQFATHMTRLDTSFAVKTSKEIEITAKAVIIAAGAGAFDYNRIPIESSHVYEGKSLFYSVKDPSIFANKAVVIAGGGDSAADWCLILSNIARKVYLIHRRSKFRCSDSTFRDLKSLEETKKLKILTPYQITGLRGSRSQISHVELGGLTGESVTLEADYLLAFFGLKPSLRHLEDWGLDITHHCINVDPLTCSTNIKGVYAVGDVAHYDSKLKLILSGFSEAATACHHIREKIIGEDVYNFRYSTNMNEVFK
ncbi:thioredoxin reductase [Neorickettsia risticii str. Illinois]|uniref:Ferredoxin--NADP reductase n=1 Tax=Neorickettsia risticii (strain Illinois) TaxID=434131 RepID=C6V5Q2_NEORI|nr:NAD(P)/FAD-dependent oxidoreductase [Neorickettsia risticii]ACT69716.1 thioredoxin reductase [Neorickettsia risticii str. Illinois]